MEGVGRCQRAHTKRKDCANELASHSEVNRTVKYEKRRRRGKDVLTTVGGLGDESGSELAVPLHTQLAQLRIKSSPMRW